MIKLQHPSDKGIIFTHASNLQGQRNVRKRLFAVQDNMSENQGEVRNYYRMLQKENKEKDQDEQLNIKMKRGKIMVNTRELKKMIKYPKYANILKCSSEQMEETLAIKLFKGEVHAEKESEFLSFTHKVHPLDDLQRGLKNLWLSTLMLHTSLVHIDSKELKKIQVCKDTKMMVKLGKAEQYYQLCKINQLLTFVCTL